MEFTDISFLFSTIMMLSALQFFLYLQPKKAQSLIGVIFFAGCGILLLLPIPLEKTVTVFVLTIAGLSTVYLLCRGLSKITVSDKNFFQWTQQLEETESEFSKVNEKRKELRRKTEKAEREIERSLRLYSMVRGLGESLSWDEMMPHIEHAVQQCLGLKNYQLYLLDETKRENLFQKVISRGVRFAEPPLETAFPEPRLHSAGIETYIAIPIRQADRQIGFLWGRLDVKNLNEDQILIDALDLSEELGMGLQKARLFSSLENLSKVDGLTGAYRRHIFNERLNEEFRRAKVFHTVFSILLCDLDHFKNINDTYGHQIGDEVLKRIGEMFRENVYETDVVARYGGEEFVILFPQADPQGVLKKAEIIREKVEQENFTFAWNKIRMTISVGVAHFPRDGADSVSLVDRADRALYAAKNSGRNRVVDSSELKNQ